MAAAGHERDTHHPFVLSGELFFACIGHEIEGQISWDVDDATNSRWAEHHVAAGGACTIQGGGIVHAFKAIPEDDPAYWPPNELFPRLTLHGEAPVSAAWSWECSGPLIPSCPGAPVPFCGSTYIDEWHPSAVLKIAVLDVPDPACEADVIAFGGPRPVVGRIDIDRCDC